ncbi:MAG TPA: hypothetical protein VHB47_24400, partial [Thermoanaerobaculia bacterium]|nr:hypothetical protein [Thermoanaerobaculia bacterium]
MSALASGRCRTSTPAVRRGRPPAGAAGRREELCLSMNSNLETVVELQQAIRQIREAEQRLH